MSNYSDGHIESRKSLIELAKSANHTLLSTGGLAIKAGGSALVKAATACRAFVNGTLVSISANTDMAALAGTITADLFNVYVFSVDSAGTLYTQMGTEGAALGDIVFPVVPADRAVIGFIIVNPTGTGNFVGGTTALDDATVVPNAVYVNTPYPFNPSLSLAAA
ncbi:hypothetical protein COW46_00870 [Candidatus Gracilibacteria bacterium CG17_big_fil_post_rev_8_21_14_2_50_48_13]|nr:MAG: hypothetical protein COW46_00870 [Candidatus Gracilibacteria bacterium CG17_big_fil_post_rev_8_21_14_2_50_48_13]